MERRGRKERRREGKWVEERRKEEEAGCEGGGEIRGELATEGKREGGKGE